MLAARNLPTEGRKQALVDLLWDHDATEVEGEVEGAVNGSRVRVAAQAAVATRPERVAKAVRRDGLGFVGRSGGAEG